MKWKTFMVKQSNFIISTDDITLQPIIKIMHIQQIS